MPGDADSYAAYWDFSSQIITPTVRRSVTDPERSTAVELGYGNGRLLRPAASYFGAVTAVALDDFDSPADPVSENVSHQRIDAEGKLPLPDDSVEFVYSHSGILRLANLQGFERMCEEISRVLKPGGVSMLWFGRMSRMPFAVPGRDWWRGWVRRPIPGQQPAELLHLQMFHARRAVMRAGMKAVALSTPLHPDTSWRLFRGGPMSYVTAMKPLR